MAILCRELYKHPDFIHKLISSGQHREMLDQVLYFFELKPDYDLSIMQPGQNLTDVTCKVLYGLRDLFQKDRPDIILVQGDTTTSMAAALAGFYAGIKVGHVEAGLRTHDLQSPFPEEGNRSLTSRIASIHFAPTQRNFDNLQAEGINKNVYITGNTVIDALLFASRKVGFFSEKVKDLRIRHLFETHDRIILVTGHRRENFGEGFLQICKALALIAVQHPEVAIAYPVHLNPNVQSPVRSLLSNISNIYLTEPLDYPDFIYAMRKCYLILSDSGGVQEEAPSLGKPVLVMRDTTERPEAVEAGTVKLVGANSKTITDGINELLSDKELYSRMSAAHNPYGDGRAVERILKILKH